MIPPPPQHRVYGVGDYFHECMVDIYALSFMSSEVSVQEKICFWGEKNVVFEENQCGMAYM
jgi:hypothetical protein